MSEKSPKGSYVRISENVDKLIAAHGSERTADLIESITLNKNLTIDAIDTIDVQKLIISEICKTYKVRDTLLWKSESEIYKKARLSGIYLLHVYGKLSIISLKKKFPDIDKTRTMFYKYILKMKTIIDFPVIDKDHHKIHSTIETIIIKFCNKK